MAPVMRAFSKRFNFDLKENGRNILHSFKAPLLPLKKTGVSPKRKIKYENHLFNSGRDTSKIFYWQWPAKMFFLFLLNNNRKGEKRKIPLFRDSHDIIWPTIPCIFSS